MTIPDKNYFRVAEVAMLIEEPKSNLYYWIKIGLIKVVRVGGRIKVGRGEVLRLMNEGSEPDATTK